MKKEVAAVNVNYLNPFIEASQGVIRDIAGLESKLDKVYLRGNSFSGDEVIIVIGITGVLIGQVILTLSNNTMDTVVKEMYAGDANSRLNSDLKMSAIAELANMIVGNASSLFYKKGMKMFITTPTILTGEKIMISNKYPIICIPLELGEGKGKLEINISAVESKEIEEG